jgi:hypothetical protein
MIKGTFTLFKGEVIYIIVGQQPNPYSTSGGGGVGGTFVVRKRGVISVVSKSDI